MTKRQLLEVKRKKFIQLRIGHNKENNEKYTKEVSNSNYSMLEKNMNMNLYFFFINLIQTEFPLVMLSCVS